MLHSGQEVSGLEESIDEVVCKCAVRMKHSIKKASRQSGTKDYLEKIIQLIRGCGFGVAIFSEFTPAATLANIFFEIGLCSVLGKPVVLVKSARAKPPSDFVRTEWITFEEGNRKRLAHDLEKAITSIHDLADYYENLGDLALEADEVDLELAFERYRQAVLIAGKSAARRKIKKILTKLVEETSYVLPASTSRLRRSIKEFDKLLPRI